MSMQGAIFKVFETPVAFDKIAKNQPAYFGKSKTLRRYLKLHIYDQCF